MTDRSTMRLPPLLRAMRPNQWTKNAVVLAAFVFAVWDRYAAHPLGWPDFGRALAAAALFSLVSSGIYLLNDWRDRESDRCHPIKRLRPLAAGELAPAVAVAVAVCLLTGGLVAGRWLSDGFVCALGAYIALQLAYTFLLKHVALLDVMLVAAGFVLRAVAGGLALDVEISSWLLICTFLLALFLALCKRRHEKELAPAAAGAYRASLDDYDTRLLDQLIGIASTAAIVTYAIYTLWPATVDKFGTANLSLTIPFVIFGVFRYLDLVYRHEQGGRPEKILLTDVPLIVNLVLYGVAVVLIFVLRGV